jgi:radical SAM superfamily enzyme YgiQ (UPF0313 family)
MKILLIYTNRYSTLWLAPPPIGLAYLIPPLKKKGHEVKVLDLMFSKKPKQEIEAEINEFKPQAVGFSIRNLDNFSMLEPYSPLPEIKEFVSIVKNKNIVTIIGGTAFSTLPEVMFDYMNADYGISGEGIKTLPVLIESISNEKLDHEIPGLVYREDGKIKSNPPLIEGYKANPEIDWKSINMDEYRKKYLTPAFNVITKTGCPNKCSYCKPKITFGDHYILRDPKAIVDDIREINKNFGAKTFFFTDPGFNSPLDWAKGVLREIINANLNIQFMAVLNPIRNCYDDELFMLYKKAGGFFATVSYESFSQKMLKTYKKPFNIEDIYNFNKLVNKHGLKILAELLFGGPGENAETIKESMDFIKKINYALCMYGLGIRILPNTEICEIAKNEGIIKSANDLLFPKHYVSKDLDIEWAIKYLKANIKEYRIGKVFPFLLKNLYGKLLNKKY